MGLQWQVLLVGAITPVVLIMTWTFLRDRLREPPKVVLLTLLFGALATIPIVLVQGVLAFVFGVSMPPTNLAEVFVVSFILAALVEEIFKWLVLECYPARHSAFDEPYDGIVYGVAASLGFALAENLLYVLGAGLEGFEAGASVALARAFLAVPMHTSCGAVLGVCIGVARFCPTAVGRMGWRALGLVGAVGLHGVYDVFAFVGGAEDASEQLRLLAPLGLVLTTGLGLTISALAAARLRRDQVRDAVLRESAQAAKLRFEAVRVEPTSGRLVGVPKLPLAALVASGIGLFALVVAMAIVVVTVEMDATVLDDALSEESAASVDGSTIGGLLVMAGLAADAVAFVLAVTALLVERRWRPASIVALIGSVLPLGAVVVLLLLGLLAALVG
ncbi:MAG: PrsW family glutamic-type intramembrane protease [Limnohabitans sp.]|nr:PrsW family glutamic-type intramembrane protease [Limnohabitans sp.]